jgi:hypothetical protein
MKKDFQIELIINTDIFYSANENAQNVKSILDWARQSAACIAVTDEQIHQVYYMDKTKMLVTVYQN